MTTTFNAAVDLGRIVKHPKNPRHRAIADDELVESVKTNGLVQPLVVAPVNGSETYTLIAGHRRLDALKKAKAKTAPVIVRTDLATEGQQIEAMLIENGRREDLTAIEEAEGYQQLELLGYKQAAIATAVGRDVKTIRARLKLLKLSATTKKKVHAGQLNLEDATAMLEFADEPEVAKKLEAAAADGRLRYALDNARNLRDRRQTNAGVIAQLLDAGATEFPLPADGSIYAAVHNNSNRRVLYDGQASWAGHDDCLAFIHDTANPSWPSVTVFCNDTSRHAADELSEADRKQAERNAEFERARAEREERLAKATAAENVRVDTLLDLVGIATPLAPQLRDLIRVLIPQALQRVEAGDLTKRYWRVMNVPESDRWAENLWNPTDLSRTKFAQHVEDINRYSDGILVRALVTILASDAEENLYDAETAHTPNARAYYQLLTEAGHTPAPPDQEFLDALDARAEKEKEEREKKAS